MNPVNPTFQAQIQADVGAVFLNEFAETVTLPDSGLSLKLLFDQNVEVVNEEGTLDTVNYAITLAAGQVQREHTVFIRNGQRWKVGRLLERAPDGLLETWEVTPEVLP